MTTTKPVNLWTSNEHARDYLERADSISHRGEGESALLEFIPASTRRILDLGTGDGRLLALVRHVHADTEAVAVDFSPTMLEAARKRFAGEPSVRVVAPILTRSFLLWASLMRSFRVSRFIIWCTSASGRCTRRFTAC